MMMATVNNCGGWQRVAPPGGIEPRLSTNPFCAAVPTGQPATRRSSSTSGPASSPRERSAATTSADSAVPEGWLLDHKGQPTTDPAVLYEPPLGTILPLGGAQSYKGFGLGLILELWAGGLSGGRCSQPEARPSGGNNVVFLVLDPARFAGSDSCPARQPSWPNSSERLPVPLASMRSCCQATRSDRCPPSTAPPTASRLDDNHWSQACGIGPAAECRASRVRGVRTLSWRSYDGRRTKNEDYGPEACHIVGCDSVRVRDEAPILSSLTKISLDSLRQFLEPFVLNIK